MFLTTVENASGYDAQFEQHHKVHLIDETYCSCVCLLVFLVDLCGRAVHDFDGTLHADTNDSHRPSLHCESDSLVVKNAGQLDRKHVVILGAWCACSLPSCKQHGWVRTSVDIGQGWAIRPQRNTAFTLDAHTPYTGRPSPVLKLNRIVFTLQLL